MAHFGIDLHKREAWGGLARVSRSAGSPSETRGDPHPTKRPGLTRRSGGAELAAIQSVSLSGPKPAFGEAGGAHGRAVSGSEGLSLEVSPGAGLQKVAPTFASATSIARRTCERRSARSGTVQSRTPVPRAS